MPSFLHGQNLPTWECATTSLPRVATPSLHVELWMQRRPYLWMQHYCTCGCNNIPTCGCNTVSVHPVNPVDVLVIVRILGIIILFPKIATKCWIYRGPDQGHLYPNRTRASRMGSEHSSKEPSRQLICWLFGTTTWAEAGAATTTARPLQIDKKGKFRAKYEQIWLVPLVCLFQKSWLYTYNVPQIFQQIWN